MRDTLKAECVLTAVTRYIDAKVEHDLARSRYDGYSWGYHGSSYIQAMEDAAEAFEKALADLIAANSQRQTEERSDTATAEHSSASLTQKSQKSETSDD
jgi:hypothetical protein